MKKPDPAATILSSVLGQIPFDGWTQRAFDQGIRAANVTPGDAAELFPRGIPDVIRLFGETIDQAVESKTAAFKGYKNLRVREKIAFAVRARLEAMLPQKESLRRLIAWYALPGHWSVAAERLYKTVDQAWVSAGDQSTDFNFYTKRALLAGVVKTTTLFWLDDESEGASESWAFLDRRIDDVLKTGRKVSDIMQSIRGRFESAT